jgi:hypothetical protein
MLYHVTDERKVEACRKNEQDAFTHFTHKEDAEAYAAKREHKHQEQIEEQLRSAARCGRELESIVARSGDVLETQVATSAGLRAAWWSDPLKAQGAWTPEDETLAQHLIAQIKRKHATYLARKYGGDSLTSAQQELIYAQAARRGLTESAKAEREYRKLVQSMPSSMSVKARSTALPCRRGNSFQRAMYSKVMLIMSIAPSIRIRCLTSGSAMVLSNRACNSFPAEER